MSDARYGGDGNRGDVRDARYVADGAGDADAGDAGAGDARHPTVAHGKRRVFGPRHGGEPSPSGGRVPCAGA